MNKRCFISVSIVVFILTLSIMLTGCGDTAKTPDELIKENFGGQEFNISFNSESLDVPIGDVKYSANEIPKLPVPRKVGYIFEGWFFDKEFTMPYTDAALKLAMQDVSLYPKWMKEKFEHNGTYELEFDATIVEGTVHKGKTTDVYGGYDDLSKAFIKDECRIEKSDDKLLLKLQYDAGALTPFQTMGDVYSISINEKMGTDIYIKNKIDSLADKIKTIFIKIDKWDLSTTMFLDVTWINYHDDRGVDETNRYDTATTYEVAIDLTKIIGFEEAFANPELPLEEGYYIAKSYFRKENNQPSMGAVFNPVYSYLYSDGNKHYKLIKQNYPYLGLVKNQHPLYNPLYLNYHDRLASFVSNIMVFDIDNSYSRYVVNHEYYPEIYNGGYYRRSVTEYHADEGRYYNIIDLDSDLTKEYIALTAVSGFMEVADGMGYIRQILSIDYDNLIKIPDCDYKPLNGDFYEYESDFSFYPGYLKDINKLNLAEQSILDYGMSIEMPNFYYEAISMDSSKENKKVLSFAMEVTPTKETSAIRLADSRNVVGEFNVNHKVFGYTPRNGQKLYLDRMNPQSFVESGYNNQLRDVTEIKTGHDIKKSENIDLREIFRNKINDDIDFSWVKYKAYEINNNKIDFDREVSIPKQFVFNRDIAIEFSYNSDLGISKTILELKDIEDPIFTINDDYRWVQGDNLHFQKAVETQVGTKVKFPDLKYTWGTTSYDFVQNFYEDENNEESINPARISIFVISGVQHRLVLTGSHGCDLSITDDNMYVVYELQNEFRERKNVYFEYINKPKDIYVITDDEGKEITRDDVKYRESDGIRERIPLDLSKTMYIVNGEFSFNELKSYTHFEDGILDDYIFDSYSIYTNNGKKENQMPDTPDRILDNINSFLLDKSYGAVYFYYSHGDDKLTTKYLYNMTFSGQNDYNLLTEKTYFSNTKYIIDKNFLVGGDLNSLSNCNLIVVKWVDGKPSTNWQDNDTCRPVDQGKQFSLKFMYPGTYRVTVRYDVKNSILDIDNGWSTSYSFSTLVNVKSNVGDVKVTYKTDAKHPFKGGELEKTCICNLAEGITTLGIGVFDTFLGVNKPDGLYQWMNDEGTYSYGFSPNKIIQGEEFISKFGSDEVVFTAKWEHKFVVHCDINGENVTVSANINYGNYTINFPNVRETQIPSGYAFSGWTGGMIGSNIKKGQISLPYRPDYDTPENFPDGYFNIKAVFSKIHKVHFIIDTKIADPMKSSTALNGEKINNVKDKLLIQFIDKTYGFVGWKVKGTDKILTRKEFLNYKVFEETFFEAVFAKKYNVTVKVNSDIALPVDSFEGYENYPILDASDKLNVGIIDDNYGLVGFYAEGDPSETIIDFNTYVVTSDVTLVAKFAKKYRINIEVDKNIASQVIPFYALENYRISNPTEKFNIKIYDSNYKLKGFYIKGDDSKTIINFNEYIVTGSVTFIAEFELVEVAP